MGRKWVQRIVVLAGTMSVIAGFLLYWASRHQSSSGSAGVPFMAGPLRGFIHDYPDFVTGKLVFVQSLIPLPESGGIEWEAAKSHAAFLDARLRTVTYAGEWQGIADSVSPSGRYVLGWQRLDGTRPWEVVCKDLQSSGVEYRWRADGVSTSPWPRITENHVIGISTAEDAYVLYSLDGQTSTTRPFAVCHGSEALRPVHLVADGRSADALFLMGEPEVRGFEDTGEQLWHYDFAFERLTMKAAIGLGRDSKGRRIIIDNPLPELRKVRICGEGLWNRLVVRHEAVDTDFAGFSPSGRWVVLKSWSQKPNSSNARANWDVCYSVFDTERDRAYPVVTLSAEGLWPDSVMVFWRD